MSTKVQFGYYPQQCNIKIGDITLENHTNIEERIACVKALETIHGDWLYAPQQQQKDILSGAINSLPYASRVFGLPKTHIFVHRKADSLEHVDFLIWCISFFIGMRLTATEAGFLDATPIKPGKLTDFILNSSLAEAISLSESFWNNFSQDDRKPKLITGIIHSLFLAQNPLYLPFERFNYLYIALDGCFALTQSTLRPNRHLSHAARIEWMCQQFDMPIPNWARPDNKNKTEISIVRNETIHEALFFERPLGFSIFIKRNSGNVLLEMEALICRLIVSLLGKPDCEYVKSSVNTRQRHGLDLS
jgi:hypothetical protein